MNVIVLTTGISGSSVITGFLSSAGLWTGSETIYKDGITGKYETYENKALVGLNEKLLEIAGIEFGDKERYDVKIKYKLRELLLTENLEPYQHLVRECEAHSPWIWKDPRLLLTLGFWAGLLDLNNVKVIVLHRNPYELWKSQNIKRIIYSYTYLKNAENDTRKELTGYLESQNFSFISIEYDDFVKRPEKHIEKLKEFVGVDLRKEDWNRIYKRTRMSTQLKRTFLSCLIYIKNYKNRFRG